MAIRVAAIGVGHWHALYDAAYLKALAGMSDVRLVAVQDGDTALAAERALALGNPEVFGEYPEMLRKMRPDFVIVLGRHSDMSRTAHHLLDEGFPFLIEKPVGINAVQVRSVCDKAAAKCAFAAVPFFHRLQPFVSHARRMLAEGAFGTVSHFSFRSIRPTSQRYVLWGAPWMLDPATAGGGCLRNVGLHGLDAFLHITGESAQVTGAQLSARALGERVEDHATVLLKTPSGIVATVEVGNTFPGKGAESEWKLAGRDALLVQREGALRCVTRTGEQALHGDATEPPAARALKDAIERWRSGQAPAAGLEDCYRAMCLADAAYALAQR